jgi:class 3 adenylate cyclase
MMIDVERTRALATVMFSDIVASTETARALGDGAWRRVLEEHYRRVDVLVTGFGGRRVKQTGDGVLCLFDLPGQALRCAEAMHDAIDGLSLRLRIGIHTGEMELLGDDIAGLAVHVAARVLACAGPGETWTSSTVRDLTLGGGDHDLADEGVRSLRGLGDWQLCQVSRGAPATEPAAVGG